MKNPRRCAYLATKTDTYADPTAQTPANTDNGETAVWWCVLTSTAIGPDEEPCNRIDCGTDRICYVPARSAVGDGESAEPTGA